jgi:hypothetical protein
MPGTTFLFDAIAQYYALLVADDPESQRALARLEAWFASPDVTSPDAFARLCREHRLDPQAIRDQLARRRAATRLG